MAELTWLGYLDWFGLICIVVIVCSSFLFFRVLNLNTNDNTVIMLLSNYSERCRTSIFFKFGRIN